MTGKKQQTLFTTANLTRMAILAAAASVLFVLEIPSPFSGFYKWDFSNLPVMLGAFAMGPAAGVIILLLKDLIGLTHTMTGGVGELADFLMGAAWMLPAALIYVRNKSRKNAVIGMITGTVITLGVSLLTNAYIMFPLVAHSTASFSFLMTATLPFNAVKYVVLSAVTALVYKPLSPLLHGKAR